MKDGAPPVLVLGGITNALSIARSLGGQGVPVRLSLPSGSAPLRSRFVHEQLPIPKGSSPREFWSDLLLGGGQGRVDGSVILACDDDAVEFVARNRDALRGRYVLDDSVPEVQASMLDKWRTLELASAVGVPAPRFYAVRSSADLEGLDGKLSFPVILKPVHSHLFQRAFGARGRKFFLASGPEELERHLRRALEAGLEVFATEKVPGPDASLASYYAYVDASGQRLFEYTKRVIRRFPKNEGSACYHVSDWDDEVAELGRRFFSGVGLRGFGNVEFKRDPRDGLLKIIECNPRFTAAQELLYRSGVDSARLVYNHLTGLPVPRIDGYRSGLTLWYPVRDFRAGLELRRRGELSFPQWLASVRRRHIFPYFRWSDPGPSLTMAVGILKRLPLWVAALGARERDEFTGAQRHAE